MGIFCSCLPEENYTEFSNSNDICQPESSGPNVICRSEIFNSNEEQSKSYSDELTEFVAYLPNMESDSNFEPYEVLEKRMVKSFKYSTEPKNCLVYILLDPMQTDLRKSGLTPGEYFRRFLSAIFYIGKGLKTRPKEHFVVARSSYIPPNEEQEKIPKIRQIWSRKNRPYNGVYVLKIFLNITSNEANTREAAMIDAYGIDNLTNERRGTYYVTFTEDQENHLGSFCLYRAFENFRPENVTLEYK